MQIYDKVIYLQFARDDRVVRNRKDKIRVVLLCRCENKVVVAAAKRLKRWPGESNVSAFRDISARRTEYLRACRVEINHGLDLEVRLENLVMTGAHACICKEERVVLYEKRTESGDYAGYWGTSERKSSTLIDCRQRNVCSIGGGTGVE